MWHSVLVTKINVLVEIRAPDETRWVSLEATDGFGGAEGAAFYEYHLRYPAKHQLPAPRKKKKTAKTVLFQTVTWVKIHTEMSPQHNTEEKGKISPGSDVLLRCGMM